MRIYVLHSLVKCGPLLHLYLRLRAYTGCCSLAVRMIVVYHFDSNCAKNPISLWYVCSVHTVHVPVLDVSFLTIVKLPRMLVAYKMVMCFLHSAQNIFLSICLFKDSHGVSVHYACLFRFCLSVSRSLSCV